MIATKIHLNKSRGENSNNEAILKQINQLEFPSNAESYPFTHDYSMLQVVERMELLTWKVGFNPQGTFTQKWQQVFNNPNYKPEDVIQTFYSWWRENEFPNTVLSSSN